MKLNREKAVTFLAGLILVLAVWEILRWDKGQVGGALPDITLPSYSRELIPRKYGTFREGTEPGRNPFSFSEGWQGMETVSMAPPPLPPAARPSPFLGSGASPEDVGFLYQEQPIPPEVEKPEEQQ